MLNPMMTLCAATRLTSALVLVLALTNSAVVFASEPTLTMSKAEALKYLEDEDVYSAPSNMMGQAMSAKYRNITAMIAAGVDANYKPKVGHTPLRSATSFACSASPDAMDDIAKTVQVLIAAKANVNEIDGFGLGVLMMTAQQCPGRITTLLIDAGADINQRSPQGFTPLSMAIIVGNFSSAEVLINAGARLSADAAKNLLEDSPSAELKAIVKKATAAKAK